MTALSLAGRVKEVLDVLTFARSGDDESVRKAGYTYVAGQAQLQFLGYLLLDDRIKERTVTRSPFDPPRLTADERRLLLQANSEILSVNRACIQKVAVPGNAFLDPYIGYDDHEEAGHQPELDPPTSASLVEAFCATPSAAYCRANAEVFSGGEHATLGATLSMVEGEIKKAKDRGLPEHLYAIIEREPAESINRRRLQWLLSVLVAKKTLRRLNQMLFQALTRRRLSRINFENTIAIRGVEGEGIVDVAVLTTRETIGIIPGDIVYLHLPVDWSKIDSIGFIKSVRSLAQNPGGFRLDIKVQLLSEHLSESKYFDALFTGAA